MPTPSLSSKRLEFEDAVDAMERYADLGWTDGLPIVPPTVDAVRRSLDMAGRSPSEILGADPVKGRVVTAEKAAINAVMAGCRPEYLPVVLAAVEAICEPEFNLHAVSASTMGSAVMLVVGGPVAERLGVNSGVNAFGPGHRPNATIGRAVRLVMMNAVGAVPGELDKATLGHPGKYSWCFAEAEQARPWEELHVQRGLDPGAERRDGLRRSAARTGIEPRGPFTRGHFRKLRRRDVHGGTRTGGDRGGAVPRAHGVREGCGLVAPRRPGASLQGRTAQGVGLVPHGFRRRERRSRRVGGRRALSRERHADRGGRRRGRLLLRGRTVGRRRQLAISDERGEDVLMGARISERHGRG